MEITDQFKNNGEINMEITDQLRNNGEMKLKYRLLITHSLPKVSYGQHVRDSAEKLGKCYSGIF
jgi:hypothetical protein